MKYVSGIGLLVLGGVVVASGWPLVGAAILLAAVVVLAVL